MIGSVLSILSDVPWLLLCLYGVATSVFFTSNNRWSSNKPLQWLYVFGLVGLMANYARSAASGPIPTDAATAFAAMVSFAGSLIVGVLFNIPALSHCIGNAIGGLGHMVLSLDNIVFRKTYDRADGAEARGDHATAAELYRAEIAKDPKDMEARRRLAEALLLNGQPHEAAGALQGILDATDKDDDLKCRTAWRLAEVWNDVLDGPEKARELWRVIAAEFPRHRLAQYARQRLGEEATEPTPKDTPHED